MADRAYSGFLDFDRNGVFLQSGEESDSLSGFRSRVFEPGVVYGRPGVPDLPLLLLQAQQPSRCPRQRDKRGRRQEARRQLGYVRDGEVPFVVVSPALPDDSKPAGDWWERLFPR